MTSYIAITDAETDPEAPLTSELAKKWRDNPLAIAENDASVPAALRSQVLLATIPTTSGSTWTASSLDLTPFTFLVVFIDGLSVTTGGSEPILLNGVVNIGTTAALNANAISSMVMIHIESGRIVSLGGDSTIRPATTSISIAVSPARTGDAGSIKIYGAK